MNLKIFNLSLFYFLSIGIVFSQSLTKQQMLEDVNYLDSVLKTSYSAYEFREKYTGLNINSYTQKIKDKIANKNVSRDEFYYLIKSILTYTQDEHNTIIHPSFLNGYSHDITKSIISSESIRKQSSIAYYNSFDYLQSNIKFNPKFLCVRYVDGKYYNSLPLKIGTHRLKNGMQIVKINGKNIDDVINQNLDNLYCSWDKKNKKYYSEFFYRAHREILNRDTVKLTFKDTINNNLIDVAMSNSSKIKVKKLPWITIEINNTLYFKDEKILYIRLLSLQEEIVQKYILNEIPKYNDKEVKKVVIDIRGNLGGNDLLWVKTLNLIIDKPLNTSVSVGAKDIEKSKLFYSDIVEHSTHIDKYPFIKTNFLRLNLSKQIAEFIKPDSNSIKYAGKIYIIQDRNIFSSAVGLSSLSQYSDRFKVIGEPNGKLGGMGEEPLVFLLPNSRILFSVITTLDKTIVNKPFDFLNKVDITVSYSIRDWYLRDSKSWNLYSKRFLRKKDVMFKTVMELD